ncbi:MAG: hypothetical protein HYR67_18005 [Bacteroidetes bacterium]|nr:hypothetical protein [Bacteroidota bacterium]
MKLNKYLPFAFIYFFVNAVGLPFGVLYTTILTPIFYLWISLKGKALVVLPFFFLLAPFIINHLINGVDIYFYERSILLYLTVYIFCLAFHTLIRTYGDIEDIFKKILLYNFALTILALFLVLTPYRFLFWSDWSYLTGGVIGLPRLQMLTYEPSYYSTLFVPIFAFYFVKYLLKQLNGNVLITLTMIILPLVFSFSLGVISGLALAIAVLFLVNFSKFLSSKRLFYSLSILALSSLLILIILFVFYQDNPLFIRVTSFLSGNDQSGRGRTSEAFQLAYLIADAKSIWWGVGPGQLKIIGDPIIREFYHYPPGYGQVSIPNAFAETVALFGIVGAILRLLIELYLFFRTKVLKNYFRTLLFFYIFVYQFTGSYTTNIAEYVIWILAFTNVFPEFDKNQKIQGKLPQYQVKPKSF